MIGRRAIVGLCTLCALLVSALAAHSAAAITGTTAFTCVKGEGELRGEHCQTTGTAGREYGHVAITQDQTTEAATTTAKTQNNTTEGIQARLKVTIGGIPLELIATGVGVSGWFDNRVAANGEHYVYGIGTTTFTGVEVAQPAGRGCKVTTHKQDGSGSPGEEGEVGVIHTREIAATTEGQGDFVKLQAADGGNYANFWVTCEAGKELPTVEGTWSCSGSIKGVQSGATISYAHAETTTQNTLKCKGVKAGVGIITTVSARENVLDAYTPISMTTVTT